MAAPDGVGAGGASTSLNTMTARLLVPALFGLLSLTTVACAGSQPADVAEPHASDNEAIPADVARNLSGSVVAPASPVSVETGSELRADAAKLELVVVGSGQIFDVLEYQFGIENVVDGAARAGTADVTIGRPVLQNLRIEVRPRTGSRSLFSSAASGATVGNLVLRELSADPKVKPAELATFARARVQSMKTRFDDGTIDTYEIAYEAISVNDGSTGLAVGFDLLEGRASCSQTPCPCGDATGANLGPYLEAPSGLPMPKDTIRIDRATVSVEHAVDGSATAGTAAIASTVSLEELSIEGPRERSGVCAFYQAVRQGAVSELRIDAATLVDLKSKPVIDQSWVACRAVVERVAFAGGLGSSGTEAIGFRAAGLLRSDGKAFSGWSFTQNKAITACL